MSPPRAPAWLSCRAKEKWRSLAKLLCSAGVLTHLDLDALAAYCAAYATWRTCGETIAKEGATYETPTGQKKVHPLVAVAGQAAGTMLTVAERLGLSPTGRLRLRIELPDDDDVDPFELLLSGEASEN